MKLSWAWASIPCTVTCTGKSDGGHVGDDLKGYVFFFEGPLLSKSLGIFVSSLLCFIGFSSFKHKNRIFQQHSEI